MYVCNCNMYILSVLGCSDFNKDGKEWEKRGRERSIFACLVGEKRGWKMGWGFILSYPLNLIPPN